MNIVQQLNNPAVVISLIAIPFLLVVYAVFRYSGKRADAWRRYAALHGFEFAEKEPGLAKAGFAASPLFARNPTRQFLNVVKGRTRGKPFLLFDHVYQTRSVDQNFVYSQTVAVFPDAGPAADFELGPRSFLHGLAAMFGFKSLESPDHPDFNRAFLLRGADEAGVRAVFTPDKFSFLLTKGGWSVENKNRHLVIYRHAILAPAGSAETFLEEAAAIAGLFAARG